MFLWGNVIMNVNSSFINQHLCWNGKCCYCLLEEIIRLYLLAWNCVPIANNSKIINIFVSKDMFVSIDSPIISFPFAFIFLFNTNFQICKNPLIIFIPNFQILQHINYFIWYPGATELNWSLYGMKIRNRIYLLNVWYYLRPIRISSNFFTGILTLAKDEWWVSFECQLYIYG